MVFFLLLFYLRYLSPREVGSKCLVYWGWRRQTWFLRTTNNKLFFLVKEVSGKEKSISRKTVTSPSWWLDLTSTQDIFGKYQTGCWEELVYRFSPFCLYCQDCATLLRNLPSIYALFWEKELVLKYVRQEFWLDNLVSTKHCFSWGRLF